MFFMNIIIASTTNSNLSIFWALKNDEFSKNYDSSYNWLTNKVNIPLDALFMFFMNIIIASTTDSNLSIFWALKNDEFSKNYDS